jgi:adenylate cyclase
MQFSSRDIVDFFVGKSGEESARVRQALAADEQNWEKVGLAARTLTAVIVIGWLFSILNWLGALYYSGFVVLLVAIGFAHLWVTRMPRRRVVWRGLLIAADFAVLTVAILFDNPATNWILPAPLRLELGTFDFYFVLLVSIGLTYSALRVLWAGFLAAVCWGAAVVWVWDQPGVTTMMEKPMNSGADWVEMHKDPMFVDLGVLLEQVLVIALVTGFLALAVTRARHLVQRQVDNDRKRQNLSRYLSPLIAERLETEDNPLATPNERPAALLFADLRGFTTWAEPRSAAEVFATLSELMALLTKDVFDNRGTLDKYAGDGVMASFGTPDVTAEDPADAIRCALSMQHSVAEWREKNPDVDLQLMVGVHFGTVMVGDIGAGERFEFAILGDTVNIAARLESATREQGYLTLISEACVDAARKQSADDIAGMLMDAKALLLEGIPLKGVERGINAYAIGPLPTN